MAGRPRTFDRDAALVVAMEQFWRDGYASTTISALTAAIGVAPPSLYAAFGDKDRLFEAAADHYAALVTGVVGRTLDQPTAREAVAELLHSAADGHTDPETPPGCFMMTEPRLAPQREAVRRMIVARLDQGVADGDLPPSTDTDRVGTYLLAVLRGMSACARDGGDAAELHAIADLAVTALPTAPELAASTQ